MRRSGVTVLLREPSWKSTGLHSQMLVRRVLLFAFCDRELCQLIYRFSSEGH